MVVWNEQSQEIIKQELNDINNVEITVLEPSDRFYEKNNY